MTRRCSHCSANGHNTRTCPARVASSPAATGGVKLFGVRITSELPMKKSASMGSLSHCSSSSMSSADRGEAADGYASDDPNQACCSPNCRTERKKGTPWTEDEHRMFLVGLQKLGKGDWRGISRNYVTSRTPTQVASHAQKYFIRQTNATRRKRRSSLFDMVTELSEDNVQQSEERRLSYSPTFEPEKRNDMPFLNLNLDDESFATIDALEAPTVSTRENNPSSSDWPSVVPAFYPPCLSVPVPFWSSTASMSTNRPVPCEVHEIIKPIPILPKDPIHLVEAAVMSKLTLQEGHGECMEKSSISSELHGRAPSLRRSAFHATSSMHGSGTSQSSSNAIHAV